LCVAENAGERQAGHQSALLYRRQRRTAVLRDAAGNVIGGAETFRDLSEVEALRQESSGRYNSGDMISHSPAMRKINEMIPIVAESLSTVLINGETEAAGLQRLLAQLPPALLIRQATENSNGKRHPAFDTILADLDFNRQAMLISELNLYMPRTPWTTNAPDQGYPTVRNLRTIRLDTSLK